MRGSIQVQDKPTNGFAFTHAVLQELKRAERYSTFLSCGLLELGSLADQHQVSPEQLIQAVSEHVRHNVREVDSVTALDNQRLAFLLPETSRQGAEVAISRMSDVIRRRVAELTEKQVDDFIPLKVASFPDSSGTRTIKEFLKEIGTLSS
ncbi:diguanylate cyclase [candidate division GN15 bacterium]|nr:diguanylate cyclase [candidate division GN15 bacterium]